MTQPDRPAWRVILTDTERMTGVAPDCKMIDLVYAALGLAHDAHVVYDCCSGPHLECHNERAAQTLAHVMNSNGIEVCP